MRRCWVLQKKGEFCQLKGDWWFFCGFHKWQLIRWARRGAVVIIPSLALFAGLKVDLSDIISQYFPDKAEIPRFNVYITPPELYRPGLLVDGLSWQEDYREYYLTIRNNSGYSDMYNTETYIDFPGLIVKHEAKMNTGFEHINFTKEISNPVSKRCEIVEEVFGVYVNNLKITASKILKKAELEMKFILWYTDNVEYANQLEYSKEGLFYAQYDHKVYKDEEDIIRRDAAFKISIRDNNKKALSIDMDSHVEKSFKRRLGFRITGNQSESTILDSCKPVR
jgi:hypothetical protein